MSNSTSQVDPSSVPKPPKCSESQAVDVDTDVLTTLPSGSYVEGNKPDLNRRALRWNYPGVSGASVETTELQYAGSNYTVHNNAYVSIVPTNICNASCGFCVTELLKATPGGDPSSWNASTAESTRAFTLSLHETMKFLEPINPAITITGGGEPTISPRLPAMLEAIQDHNLSKLVINTNGTRLLKKAAGEAYMVNPPLHSRSTLDHLLEAGLNHLNLSVSHHNPEQNARLMEFPESVDLPSLDDVVREAVASGCRPRLSLVLLKDGISDLESFKEYLNWAVEIGVDDILVRELAGYDTEAVRFSRTTIYANEQRVPLNALLDELQSDPSFKFLSQKSGTSHYRENYRYRDAVDIGFAVYRLFSREESLQQQSTAKWFVLQPTGALNTGWEDWDRNIIPSTTRSA